MAILRRKTRDERRENCVGFESFRAIKCACCHSRRRAGISSLVVVAIFVLASAAFAAPKSASAYYSDAAFQYIENRLPTAEITCNEGLQYYPNDQKLQMLLDRIHEAKTSSKTKIRRTILRTTRIKTKIIRTKTRIRIRTSKTKTRIKISRTRISRTRISRIRTRMATRAHLAPRMTRIRINRIKVRTVSLATDSSRVPIAMAVPINSNSLNSPKGIPATVTAVNRNSSRFNLVK